MREQNTYVVYFILYAQNNDSWSYVSKYKRIQSAHVFRFYLAVFFFFFSSYKIHFVWSVSFVHFISFHCCCWLWLYRFVRCRRRLLFVRRRRLHRHCQHCFIFFFFFCVFIILILYFLFSMLFYFYCCYSAATLVLLLLLFLLSLNRLYALLRNASF